MFSDVLEETLLPVVNMWAIKQGAFNNKIMDELFNDLINTEELLQEDSSEMYPDSTTTPSILVKKLSVITHQVPFMAYSVISSSPTHLQDPQTYPQNDPTTKPILTLDHLLEGSQ